MTARPTFDDAVSRLNGRGLIPALSLCSGLSLYELGSGPGTVAFPMLNQEKVRVLGDAVLRSNAAEYKTGVVSDEDLAYILNGCHKALDDERLRREVPDGAERLLMLYRLQTFFSRMAFFQIRLQQLFLSDFAGRLIATLAGLARRHLASFPEDKRGVVSRMPEKIEGALGTSIEVVACFPTAILALGRGMQEELSREATRQFDGAAEMTNDHRQAAVVKALARKLQRESGRLFFDAKSVADRLAFASLSDVEACLRVYTAGMAELRQALSQPEFSMGPQGWRLSPFARYPIVRVRGDRPYVVPNFRYLLRNFADVTHFYVQSRVDEKEYNEYRGAVQEVYVAECVRRCLPSVTVVTERTYDRPGAGQVRGPDVVVIDPSDRSIVAIECKARRISVDTRVNLSDETLSANLDDIEKILLGEKKTTGLPKKIDELYAGLPVYGDIQGEIYATEKNRTICAVVLGEAVAQYTKLIRSRLAANGGILSAFPYPFVILDLETFERAVEICAAEQISLAALLREFWDASGYFELDGTIPEDFPKHTPPPQSVFAGSFFPIERGAAGG